MRLALDYRPQTFDTIVGQPQAVNVLRAAIKIKALPQALLFTGIRGTGKTSAARIVARALNCESLTEQGSPCNECQRCKAILAKNFPWCFEIDAATNNGVDSIRQLVDRIGFAPPSGIRAVWIIDECHRLTGAASDAFLKCLEEPPAWVTFILCTTEVQSVMDTVRSRCLKIEFRRISDDLLVKLLTTIVENQKIEYDDQVLFSIVREAGGSARDAITMLQSFVSLGSAKAATQAGGLFSDRNRISDLYDHLIIGKLPEMLQTFKLMIDEIGDEGVCFDILSGYAHSLVLIYSQCGRMVMESQQLISRMVEQADTLGQEGLDILLRFWSERVRFKLQINAILLECSLIVLLKDLEQNRIIIDPVIINKFVSTNDKVSVASIESHRALLLTPKTSIEITIGGRRSKYGYYIPYEMVVDYVIAGIGIDKCKVRRNENVS